MFGTAKELIEKLENYPEDEPLLMVVNRPGNPGD